MANFFFLIFKIGWIEIRRPYFSIYLHPEQSLSIAKWYFHKLLVLYNKMFIFSYSYYL